MIEKLTDEIRSHLPALFKVCESLAMLDMLSGFAQLATSQNYGMSIDISGIRSLRPFKCHLLIPYCA